jgi:spermidine dehydrogenase
MGYSDRELGMDRRISRRDFVNGACAVLGAAAAGHSLAGPGSAGLAAGPVPDGPAAGARAAGGIAARGGVNPFPYPPALTGMRGSGYPAAYATGHALRDGTFWASPPKASATSEHYDLVVVGGGISGLATAYLYQKRHGFTKSVLILDNHDDFGGHAKRNEFRTGSDLRISNAGSFNIYAGRDSTPTQREIYRDLGIDVQALARRCVDPGFYARLGMGQSVFFDRETFGADRLLKDPAPWTDFTYLYTPNVPADSEDRWRSFLRQAPLPEKAKLDLYRLYHDRRDYMPESTPQEKERRLNFMSYQQFLTDFVGCHPMVCTYLRDRTYGSGRGLSSTTALSAHRRFGLPGFDGMNLPEPESDDGVEFHFPEGNATVARLLVRRLIPAALPGATLEDSMLRQVDYSRLDRAGNATRVRLSSTVVHARNSASPDRVEVSYVQGDSLSTVTGGHCVLACWNYLIPYLCPEMTPEQKDALHYGVHTPNLWINVWLRDWRAFQRAGANFINAPGSYYASLILEQPVSVGGYRHSQRPDRPTVLTMLRGYDYPGLHIKDQFRRGRAEMYATSFETFERNLREQLARALGPSGFDPAADISGITVNRWGHGYAYWYSPLYDDFIRTGGEPPHLRARVPFGRIGIANTASGADDSTELAIDMAARALTELSLI